MGGFSIGPRVFMAAPGWPARGSTRAAAASSTRRCSPCRRDDGAAVDALAERIRKELPGATWYDVDTYREAQPALREGLKRAERFLGLVALLSLLVGGIGVAQAVRAWIAGRLDAIAVLRALGVRPREVLALYLGADGAAGPRGERSPARVLGIGPRALAPLLLRDLLPAVPVRFLAARSQRCAGVALGHRRRRCFQPSAARRRSGACPPVRVLAPRRRAAPGAPLAARGWPCGAAVLGGVFVAAPAQAGSLRTAAAVHGRDRGARSPLLARGRVGGGAPGRARRRAAPRRSGCGTGWRRWPARARRRSAAIVALGLGVTVVLATQVVQEPARRSSSAPTLPAGAPTAFLVDIQPDQWDGVRAQLEERRRGGRSTARPVVVARLATIDGEPRRGSRRRDDPPADGRTDGGAGR